MLRRRKILAASGALAVAASVAIPVVIITTKKEKQPLLNAALDKNSDLSTYHFKYTKPDGSQADGNLITNDDARKAFLEFIKEKDDLSLAQKQLIAENVRDQVVMNQIDGTYRSKLKSDADNGIIFHGGKKLFDTGQAVSLIYSLAKKAGFKEEGIDFSGKIKFGDQVNNITQADIDATPSDILIDSTFAASIGNANFQVVKPTLADVSSMASVNVIDLNELNQLQAKIVPVINEIEDLIHRFDNHNHHDDLWVANSNDATAFEALYKLKFQSAGLGLENILVLLKSFQNDFNSKTVSQKIYLNNFIENLNNRKVEDILKSTAELTLLQATNTGVLAYLSGAAMPGGNPLKLINNGVFEIQGKASIFNNIIFKNIIDKNNITPINQESITKQTTITYVIKKNNKLIFMKKTNHTIVEQVKESNELISKINPIKFENSIIHNKDTNKVLEHLFRNGYSNTNFGKARFSQIIDPSGLLGALKPRNTMPWAVGLDNEQDLEGVNSNFTEDNGGLFTPMKLRPLPHFQFVKSKNEFRTINKWLEESENFRLTYNEQFVRSTTVTYDEYARYDKLDDYKAVPYNVSTLINPDKTNEVLMYIDIVSGIGGQQVFTTKVLKLENTLIKGYNPDFSLRNKYPIASNKKLNTIKTITKRMINKFSDVVSSASFLKDAIFTNKYSIIKGNDGKIKDKHVIDKPLMSVHMSKLLIWLSEHKNAITEELIDNTLDKVNTNGSLYLDSLISLYTGYDMTDVPLSDNDPSHANSFMSKLVDEFKLDPSMLTTAEKTHDTSYGQYSSPLFLFGKNMPDGASIWENINADGIRDFDPKKNLADLVTSWISTHAKTKDNSDYINPEFMQSYSISTANNPTEFGEGDLTLDEFSPGSGGKGTGTDLKLRFVVHNQKEINDFKSSYPNEASDWASHVIISTKTNIDLSGVDLSNAVFRNMDMNLVTYDSHADAFSTAVFDGVSNLSTFMQVATNNGQLNVFKWATFTRLGNEVIDFSNIKLSYAKFSYIKDASNINFGTSIGKAGQLISFVFVSGYNFDASALTAPQTLKLHYSISKVDKDAYLASIS